jgi:hypothetical protein
VPHELPWTASGGDTCRNISIGFNNLRSIKVRKGGRFFKPLHKAATPAD